MKEIEHDEDVMANPILITETIFKYIYVFAFTLPP